MTRSALFLLAAAPITLFTVPQALAGPHDATHSPSGVPADADKCPDPDDEGGEETAPDVRPGHPDEDGCPDEDGHGEPVEDAPCHDDDGCPEEVEYA